MIYLFFCFVATETGVERQYILKGYGIPIDVIPITFTGSIKTVFLKQWIKLRLRLEDEDSPDAYHAIVTWRHSSSLSAIVEFPGSNDVLYRTGTITSCHPGNAAFRELIESHYYGESPAGSQLSLSMLAEKLINEIVRNRNGRFLRWDNHGYWTVMDDQAQINVKVTASIRDFKRMKDAKTNMQSIDSSTERFKGQDLKRRKTASHGSGFLDTATPNEEEPSGRETTCMCDF